MDAKELLQKAQRLFIEGRHKESIDAFTESITAGGKSEIVFLSRGVAYLKTEQTEKAIEDFSRVIDLNNRNMRAHYYRGITYLIKENHEKAISDLDRAIELKPDHGPAFFARGTAYAQTGNDYEATKNIKTAITFSEANMQAFSDSFGVFRAQFDKVMSIMTDVEKTHRLTLSVEEIETVKKWLDERDH
ncbi:MAG TPA: tetratricopeptide repeat protein [Nitrospirae bacterium]|nr:tetratricopeptide repeat protein [Nitrospirota bacterium]HDZ01169.1 tetratricopeptide repeat protein [Nitrospirota bacterium]